MPGTGRPKGSPKPAGSGRAPGTPNKATLDARRAIGDFVDGNAHRLEAWLNDVAQGVPMVDPDTGKQLVDSQGQPRWLVVPNPQKAYELFQNVVEYHVPRLARSEVTGAGGGPVQLQAQNVDLRGLSDAELKQMELLLGKAGTQGGAK